MNMVAITVGEFLVSALVRCLCFEGSGKRKFDIPEVIIVDAKRQPTGSVKVKMDLC